MRSFVLALAVATVLGGCVSSSSLLGPAASTTAALAASDCLSSVHGIDLQRASIADLQRALAAGTVTSVELVDAYAARVAAFDSAGPKVNSVQGIMPDARAQAAALDAERASGHVRGPLHGIPILLKDNIGANGMPTTAGSIALEKNVPSQEATLTADLRSAGMVVLGKTHLSEFANWMALGMPNGYSTLGGQVVNAYTGGDPSGSSSGSGVAGSMAFATITIGTETSGSILGPSDANSLVGVKPTLGLVSRAGVIPLAANFDTPGPMGRSVADVAVVLGAIAGPDEKDAATKASASHLPTGKDYTASLNDSALQGVRLGFDPRDNDAIFMKAMGELKQLGATLVPMDSNLNPNDAGVVELGLIPNEFKFGLNDYLAHQAGPGLPVKDLTDIILFNQQHPDKAKYGQSLLIASDASQGEKNSGDAASIPVIQLNRALADQVFATNNVQALIGPHLRYVNVGAAAGYPTVIVPAGYNGKNPEGVSFFGPAWSEAKLLAFAYAFEQGTHHRQPPTAINPKLLDGVCGGAPGAKPAGGAPSNDIIRAPLAKLTTRPFTS